MAAPIPPCPPTKHVDEGSAAQAQRHRPAEIGIIKRRRVRLTISVLLTPRGRSSQMASGACCLMSFNIGPVTS